MTQRLDLDTLIAQVNEQSPEGDALSALEAALDLNQQLGDLSDKVVSHFVDEARRQGHSWSEIGGRMGVSKQAARKRFVDTDPVVGTVARRRGVTATVLGTVASVAAPAARAAVGISTSEPTDPTAGAISVRAARSSAAPAGMASVSATEPQFDVAVRPAAEAEAAPRIYSAAPSEPANAVQVRAAVVPAGAGEEPAGAAYVADVVSGGGGGLGVRSAVVQPVEPVTDVPRDAPAAGMVVGREMLADDAPSAGQYLATTAEREPLGAVIVVDPVEPVASGAVAAAAPVEDPTPRPAVVLSPELAPAAAAAPASEPLGQRATRGDGEQPAASLEHSTATCTSCGASSAEPRYVARRDGLVICLDCLQDH